MNREEFLDILRQQLEGNVPSDTLYSQLSYYRDYIDREIASGKSEESVLAALGDPHLIAKTLIDTDDIPQPRIFRDRPIDTDYRQDGAEEQASSDEHQEAERDRYGGNPHRNDNSKKASPMNLGDLSRIILIVLVALVVIVLVITILRALLPVLIIVAVAAVILILLRRYRRG